MIRHYEIGYETATPAREMPVVPNGVLTKAAGSGAEVLLGELPSGCVR